MSLLFFDADRPSRLRVRAVCGDFAYTAETGENSEWQSYKYVGWPNEKRALARALWQRIGARTVWIAPTLRYQEVTVDSRETPLSRAHFVACVQELLAAGLIPFVQVGQPETYGVKSDEGIQRLLADLDCWARWGWIVACDGLGVDLWPESNEDTTPAQIIAIARTVRAVLPHSYIGLHVGRSGDGLYQGDDQYDRERFWREIRPSVDALLWEAKTEIFETAAWQRALWIEAAGAVARITRLISRDEARALAASAGFALSDDELENICRSAPITGGGVDTIFWEGPEFGLRWASRLKRVVATVAMHAGCVGSLVGIPLGD